MIAKPGYPSIILSLILFLFSMFYLNNYFFSVGIFVIILFLAFFFRDPKRTPPPRDSSILSPADGKVTDISIIHEPYYFKGDVLRVSIFLSVLNVHVNRSPIYGKVTFQKYFPGMHLVAFHEKASEKNERNLIVLKNDQNIEIGVIQIAGILARRIVSWVEQEDSLKAGEHFGMIKLGSCVQLYLPCETKTTIEVGDKVRGGETIIGYFS